MAEKPILFSGPMVRALLAGTKTQTRRVINPQPREGARYTGIHYASDEPDSFFFNTPIGPQKVRQRIYEDDRLYVREHWRTVGSAGQLDDVPPRDLGPQEIWYVADGEAPANEFVGKFRQGMHMPRWASRITLTVTDVRVQRLQEISEEDAAAEGLTYLEDGPGAGFWVVDGLSVCGDGSIEAYAQLWEAINGPGSWDANPFVAAYTFTVEQVNIDLARAA